jgi:tRNA nucleotidyltransferase (CCA-adding enzyme)
MEALISEWLRFLHHLDKMDVLDAPAVKPLVDGRTLCDSLGTKPGKWMAEAMDVCLAWQFRNPGIQDKEGAIEEVRERRDELGIPSGK